MHRGIVLALAAAVLFGASTPFAKLVVASAHPVLLAGLLYLGSGLGLSAFRLLRDRGWAAPGLVAGEWRWLTAAVLFGGVLGPVALLIGLARTDAASASLLLNLEGVLTALIAWTIFREHCDRRLVIGMLAIVAGGVLLAWPSQQAETGGSTGGALWIAVACACWAIDNNLTRRISGGDAVFIATIKGLTAGAINLVIAWMLGASWPAAGSALSTLAIGLVGYGISLALFVLALRELGAARTGAYFSLAPFVGVAVALALPGGEAPPLLWLAALLMGVGLWLHLSERHDHEHHHEPLEHSHLHWHDEHHHHEHSGIATEEPHVHRHTHTAVTHKHPHFPDLHHRHNH